MRTRIHARLTYSAAAPCTVLMQLKADDGSGQRVLRDRLSLGPHSDLSEIPADASVGRRIWLNVTEGLDASYEAEVEVTRPRPDWNGLSTDPLPSLPPEAVTYLMSSRYCRADALGDFLPATFNGLCGGPLVRAMADWIKASLTYDIFASTPETTALDTFAARRGVCRDYAHLLITMARSSAIPARIVSVYGPDVDPPDFHAVAEVWLSGGWHMIDPTGMATADRLVRIGVGRDAADVAFLTAFGFLELQEQSVSCRTG